MMTSSHAPGLRLAPTEFVELGFHNDRAVHRPDLGKCALRPAVECSTTIRNSEQLGLCQLTR